MPRIAKYTVLIRLLACLLLLGTQTWTSGLRAAHLSSAIFEMGALPSEVEDQNEGPHHDREPGVAESLRWSLPSTMLPGAVSVVYVPGFDRSGLSLLPVAGIQPSAP